MHVTTVNGSGGASAHKLHGCRVWLVKRRAYSVEQTGPDTVDKEEHIEQQDEQPIEELIISRLVAEHKGKQAG